jgi:hypothetical protein
MQAKLYQSRYWLAMKQAKLSQELASLDEAYRAHSYVFSRVARAKGEMAKFFEFRAEMFEIESLTPRRERLKLKRELLRRSQKALMQGL